MHPGDMTQVHQVRDFEAVVHIDAHLARFEMPVRVFRTHGETNQIRIGLRRIAYPYPDPAVAHDHGECAHLGVVRDHHLSRNFGTTTIGPNLIPW